MLREQDYFYCIGLTSLLGRPGMLWFWSEVLKNDAIFLYSLIFAFNFYFLERERNINEKEKH